MLAHGKVWWKNIRSGSFICLIVMLIFGAFSITATSLLIRSEKKTSLEEDLSVAGDYDIIVYEAAIGYDDLLATSDKVVDVGAYYELGTVTNEEDAFPFRAVAMKDELSEDIYHLRCFRGSLPRKENEIALDISVANAYCVAAYPGETVKLKRYDEKGDPLGEKEYVISGVYKLSDPNVVAGWYRASDIGGSYDAYSMPGVFFSPSVINEWGCERETVFFRGNTEFSLLYDEAYRILAEDGRGCLGVESHYQRSSLTVYHAGVELGYETSTQENIEKAVDKGKYTRDFYAGTVFPIISVLVVLTEAISLYMLSKNIIANRKDHYAVLRSIGMSSKRIIGGLLAEMLGFGLASTFIGIGLGYATHGVLIRFLNRIFHARLFDGIHVGSIIKKVSYDPVTTAVLVCIISLVLSLIIPLFKLYRMYPSELLATSESMFVGKTKARKKSSKVRRNWLGLLNRRINLHQVSTLLVMMIVLSALLFGYVFFRAYSEMATADKSGNLIRLDIDGEGYVAKRSSDLQDIGNNVSNRHDAGIVPTMPEKIEQDENVEKAWSVILNQSTRAVFTEPPEDGMQKLLGYRNLNRRECDDPVFNSEKNCEEQIFGHMGYDWPVYMYELPTVGITAYEMNSLSGEIVSGNIDIDKIRSGEEVVLAVPSELKDLCLQYYPVGSEIGFDDILLNEEEENLNRNEVYQEKWVVVDEYIETENGSQHVGWTSFGTRCCIRAKVGAIVALSDEKDVHEFLTSGSSHVNDLNRQARTIDPNDPKPQYGMSILCLPDSFTAWGLPDRNFTSVKVEMKEDADLSEFDKLWYRSLAGSNEIESETTYYYAEEVATGKAHVMTVFFVLISILILLGIMSIVSGLYTKTRSNLGRFQTLRRVGLSVNQASLMIYTQNMIYPLIGTLFAIVPVYAVQRYFNVIYHKMQTGELPTDGLELPWYCKIPVWADLFSYNFVPALICCFVIGLLLILIGTLPQILYLRKMKMIESREE